MYSLTYVLHEIISNAGPVIITTKKLNVQLLALHIIHEAHHGSRSLIESDAPQTARQQALAFVVQQFQRALCHKSEWISISWHLCKLTYSQAIPSHPTAKKELNAKRRTALITRAAELLMLPKTARRIMVTVCPADPKNINLRRPTLSIKKTATNDARKYSVALHAAMIRDLVSEICRRSNNKVCI